MGNIISRYFTEITRAKAQDCYCEDPICKGFIGESEKTDLFAHTIYNPDDMIIEEDLDETSFTTVPKIKRSKGEDQEWDDVYFTCFYILLYIHISYIV